MLAAVGYGACRAELAVEKRGALQALDHQIEIGVVEDDRGGVVSA